MPIKSNYRQCEMYCPAINNNSFPCCPPCCPCPPFPPVPPFPPCPPVPPCPPCPPCPPPVPVPTITGTPAYRSYLQVPVTQSGNATIANIFAASDGIAPFTVTDVEIIGNQQAVNDVQITPVVTGAARAASTYTVTGTTQVFAWVTYTDATAFSHRKLVSTTMPFSTTLTTEAPVDDMKFVSYLSSATATNPVLTNNTLTFSYTASITLQAIDEDAKNYAVVDASAQNIPSNLPTENVSLLPIEGICEVDANFSTSAFGLVPFTANGTAPYTVVSIVPQAGDASVVDYDSDSSTTALHVAIPVQITVTSSDSITTTQNAFLYTTIVTNSITYMPNTRFYVDLTASQLVAQATGDVAIINGGLLIGTIAQVASAPVSAVITPVVQCGEIYSCLCMDNEIPPNPNYFSDLL